LNTGTEDISSITNKVFNSMRKPKNKARPTRLEYTPPNTSLDLEHIHPKTINQEAAFDFYRQNKNLVMYGSAGTGKTFIACYLAMEEILYGDGTYKKVVFVRSAVQTRDMGFMPGNSKEKAAYYEAPYVAILSELFGRSDARIYYY
jgi:phosphate starvation-inducible PhoH-like protein